MVWELCEQPFHLRSCILHFFPFSAESDHYLQSYITYLLVHQKTSLASISTSIFLDYFTNDWYSALRTYRWDCRSVHFIYHWITFHWHFYVLLQPQWCSVKHRFTLAHSESDTIVLISYLLKSNLSPFSIIPPLYLSLFFASTFHTEERG